MCLSFHAATIVTTEKVKRDENKWQHFFYHVIVKAHFIFSPSQGSAEFLKFFFSFLFNDKIITNSRLMLTSVILSQSTFSNLKWLAKATICWLLLSVNEFDPTGQMYTFFSPEAINHRLTCDVEDPPAKIEG